MLPTDGETLRTTDQEPNAPPKQAVGSDDARAASVEGATVSRLSYPASEPGGTEPECATTGVSISGYEIEGVLGRGGMGIVYRARQTRLNRVVALKMILAGGHAGATEVARFRTEAEAIARLQHPNIVQVHEVGEHNGLPFLSLEFCSAGSLDRKLRGTPLPAREAAALVQTLAGAMHAAHQQDVVHRDLKPANVLLAGGVGAGGSPVATPAAGEPPSPLAGLVPKVTDFGLARKTDEAGQTASGAVMGTPSYMAPEQAAGKTRAVGPAVDVYALGAILYECLTGRPPFRAATALDTILQVVRTEPVAVRQLQPQVPPDLETICLKCLAKEPSGRYATAEELADDVGRFLAGEPTRARPVGAGERLVKWARRRPALAGLVGAAALLVLLLVGLAVGLFYHVQVQKQRQRAESALTEAEQRRQEAEKATAKAEAARGEAETQRGEAGRQRDRAERLEYASHIQAAHHACLSGDISQALVQLDQCRPDLRGWEFGYVRKLCRGCRLTLKGHAGEVISVAYSPDGKRIASASMDQTVKVWDAVTGAEVLTLKGHTHWVQCVAYSPDGKRIASASPVWDTGKGRYASGEVKVWDADTGTEVRSFQGPSAGVVFSPDGKRIAGGWASIAFSPDGKRLAGNGGWVKVWDVETGTEVLTLKPGGGGGVIGWNGKRTTFSNTAGTAIWDVDKGTEILFIQGLAASVAFSPDGKRLAIGASSPTKLVKIWDADNGKEILTVRALNTAITGLAFSPDGKYLATGGGTMGADSDSTVRVWDADTGTQILTLQGHARYITRVAFSPDGTRIASASIDHTVKVWDADTSASVLTLNGAKYESVAFNPVTNRLACIGPKAKVLDADTGAEVLPLKGDVLLKSVSFSADGKRIASGGWKEVRVWAADTGTTVLSVKTSGLGVALSPDGKRLAFGGVDSMMKVLDVNTGKEVLTLKGHTDGIVSVAYSPDGKRIASASHDQTVKVWDADTGAEVLTLKGHTYTVNSVAFSPDGKHLASASADQTVRVWDANKGTELIALKGHTSLVFSVAYSPDGKRIASASMDQTVKVWDAVTGAEVLTLKGHTHWVQCVAFSPDGKRLASTSRNVGQGEVKVWDAYKD